MTKIDALTKLTSKRGELARSLKEQKKAEESLAAARKQYDEKVTAALATLKQQLEAENQEIADALNAAQKAKLDADTQVREQRDTLKNDLLKDYGANYRDDKNPIEGFARRDSIIVYHEDDDVQLVTELAEKAPWLLQVNKKALAQFVRAFATETGPKGTHPAFPQPMRGMFEYLSECLAFDRQWTISDKAIIKYAGADDDD